MEPLGIRAASSKVGDLLKDSKTYVVPPFQRNYSWETSQIEDFWNDLIELARSPSDGSHFIGSMVFTPHEDVSKVQILDGQQRFATFLIFLSALRNVLQLNDVENKEHFLQNIGRVILTGGLATVSPRPKLELNKQDKLFFEKLIAADTISDGERESHKLIKQAYLFFKENLNTEVQKLGAKFVESILYALDECLVFIKIDVDSDVDAHMIFEALNDRGLDLTLADLVKNYVLLIAGSEAERVLDFWNTIIDQIGDRDVTKFLRHYWISAYEFVRKEDLYKKFKEQIKSRNVVTFMEKLSKDAQIYGNLKEPTTEFWEDPEIVDMVEELNRFKVEQVYTLLLALYEQCRDNKPVFKQILRKLINFTFRYGLVCRLNPNVLENLYSELAIKLRKSQIDDGDVITSVSKLAPSTDTFLNAWQDFKCKGQLARYILIKISDWLLVTSGEKEKTTSKGKVHLEHIMPQKPDKEWKKFFEKQKVDAENYVDRVGNLTILLSEYNQKISNKFFTKKLEMYKKSTLPINAELKQLQQFGPDELELRQEKLGAIAQDLWAV